MEVGEALVCEREPECTSDRYVVAMKKKEGTLIGHLLEAVCVHVCVVVHRRNISRD